MDGKIVRAGHRVKHWGLGGAYTLGEPGYEKTISKGANVTVMRSFPKGWGIFKRSIVFRCYFCARSTFDLQL